MTQVPHRDVVVMVALLAATSALAAVMAANGLATWLEAVSFVSGAICVWLVVKENIWNFPIGLVNVAASGVVYFNSRLFSDAGLQVVYFLLGLIGWHAWLRGGENRDRLVISRSPKMELVGLSILALVGTIAMWQGLRDYGGPATIFDALTTSLSLVSQWLLNRKRLENWIGWIVVDAIYVPLYIYKGLYLMAILYAIFLVMAALGLRAWLERWRTAQMTKPVGPAPTEAAP